MLFKLSVGLKQVVCQLVTLSPQASLGQRMVNRNNHFLYREGLNDIIARAQSEGIDRCSFGPVKRHQDGGNLYAGLLQFLH